MGNVFDKVVILPGSGGRIECTEGANQGGEQGSNPPEILGESEAPGVRVPLLAPPEGAQNPSGSSGEGAALPTEKCTEGATCECGVALAEHTDTAANGEPAGCAPAPARGIVCVRPFGCFRPACIAEGRCRMDPGHPRFAAQPEITPRAPTAQPETCEDCQRTREWFGQKCYRHSGRASNLSPLVQELCRGFARDLAEALTFSRASGSAAELKYADSVRGQAVELGELRGRVHLLIRSLKAGGAL